MKIRLNKWRLAFARRGCLNKLFAISTNLDSVNLEISVSDTMKTNFVKMMTARFLDVGLDIPKNVDSSQITPIASLEATANFLIKVVMKGKPSS